MDHMTPDAPEPGPDQALVSVVMPVYAGDAPDYARQAVDSILAQTYKVLELIVVVDGAVPEATDRFLATLAERDARVRVVRLAENRGPARTRNHGIAAARGAYIALLDADDVAHPNRIARQRAYLEAEQADLVGSFYRWTDEAGVARRSKQMPVDAPTILKCLCAFNPIANSTVFAKAAVLKENPFPEGYRLGTGPVYGEDYALWVTLIKKGFRLGNTPEYLVDFRTGPRFFQRRRGLNRFRTDLQTKFRALRLYPPAHRPWAAVVAVASSLPRLLPAPLLAIPYWVRARLRFDSRASRNS
jgi:glycosyltransferase involved in cell wall biosynthesis